MAGKHSAQHGAARTGEGAHTTAAGQGGFDTVAQGAAGEPGRRSHGAYSRAPETGAAGQGGFDTGAQNAAGEPGGRSHSAQTSSSRKRKKSDLISLLLIIVGVVLLLIAGFIWGRAQLRYHQQAKVNKELAAYVTLYEDQATDDASGPRPPEVDWAGLKAINDEVVAWIQVPGTVINYPVYQAADNDRYLRNTATGEWSWGGQLFCDYLCTRPGMVDANTLVYGHHLLDGSMFKPIADMDNQANFDAVETVWYVTETAAYECEPLFLYYTQEDDQTARTFSFANTEEFHAYLADRLGRAVTMRADATQVVGNVQHALSLITCNYYDGYGRTILVCVPKAEAAGLVAPAVPETTESIVPLGEVPAPEEEAVEEAPEEDTEESYEEYVEEDDTGE